MGFMNDIGMSNPWEIAANIGTGGLYGLGKGAYKAGKSLTSAPTTDYRATPYDPNPDAFEFDPDGSYGSRMRAGARQAASRSAPTIATGQFSQDRARGLEARRQAQAARGLGLQSRGEQVQHLNRLKLAAQGHGPSAAQTQLATGRDAAIRSALALAGSGRNAPGAYRQAVSTGAQLSQQAGRDATQLRAQEQIQARQELGQMTQALRGQDMQLRGQDQASRQLEQARAAQAAGMAQAQAQMAQQQMSINDQAQARYEQLLAQGYSQAAAQRMALEQLRAQQSLGVQGINAGIAQGNAAAIGANRDAWLGAAASLAGSGMSMMGKKG